jgi:hypothetical protein
MRAFGGSPDIAAVGQKEAFTKGRFEDISFAYACAIEWRHSALPQAQLSLCGRKC